MAIRAVRQFGMFGDLVGYTSTQGGEVSDRYNAEVDKAVK